MVAVTEDHGAFVGVSPLGAVELPLKVPFALLSSKLPEA
jgi:hypothetical protein